MNPIYGLERVHEARKVIEKSHVVAFLMVRDLQAMNDLGLDGRYRDCNYNDVVSLLDTLEKHFRDMHL